MKTIFYNYLLGTEKLAFTITDKSPLQLMEDGVIPEGAAYLVFPVFDESMPIEEKTKYIDTEYSYFDDYTNPTEVLIDYNDIMFSIVEDMRQERDCHLIQLDNLQQRALIKGKKDLVDEIEKDKQLLRDCINGIDITKYNKPQDFQNFVPDIMDIDYKSKYELKLDA